jgi:UDP:flavonoid glycosyltransferase YjiC (YdhE family)
MARILYIWELGGDYGHIGSFMPLAQELRSRGHEVIFAIRDLSNAETVVAKHGFPLLQAPIWTADIKGLPMPPLNYTEIIIRYGFINKNALSGLNRAWLSLFSLLRPALVIADHSPVALFSARACGIPRTTYGTGFCAPPRISPMPNMRPWADVPMKRLESADQHVVRVSNNLLKDMKSKAPPLEKVADLFQVDEDFLCTFPEMDHYQQRQGGRYWGPVFNITQGAEIDWPKVEKPDAKHIFAYIKSGYRDYEKLLKILADSGHSVLVFSPGLSRGVIGKYQTATMHVTADPLNISHIVGQCDLALCHAGHGTVAAMLLSGVPLLLLPTQLEQYLASSRIKQLGAAQLVNLEDKTTPDHAALINEMLTNPKYRESARTFAKKHASFDQHKQFASMAERIEEIIAEKSTARKTT